MFDQSMDANESFKALFAKGEVNTNSDKDVNVAPNQAVHSVLKDDRSQVNCNDQSWALEGYGDKGLKKLIGEAVQAKHDYHGYKVAEAWKQLNFDLAQDISQGFTVVEVVHGKGKNILRPKIRGWLKDSDWVSGFTESAANNQHSVKVKLKRN